MQTLTRRIYKEGLKASALLQQQHKLMEFRRTLTSMPKYLPQHLPSAFANSSHWSKLAGATLVGCGIGQYYYGNQKDFYDYRFITDKDPDDLASFCKRQKEKRTLSVCTVHSLIHSFIHTFSLKLCFRR